jgi:DNA-binding transcriptional LysR family regulator
MELRQLRYFVAVADTGNISRAAKAIFLTQPALSRQIKALEDELGQRLLERRAHSVQLTAAGRAMLHEARELLQHADAALARVRHAGTGVRLRVGYAPSLAGSLVTAAIANFSQVHPGAKVELFDLSTAEMLAGLESDRLDVVLAASGKPAGRDLRWTGLVRTSWKLAVKRDHLLARRPRVTPAEVAGEPLLLLGRGDYPEYCDIVTGWLRAHRQRPKVAGEYDGAESLLAGVEAGLGVALVTARTAQRFPGRVRFKLLSLPPEPLCIAIGTRASRAEDKPLGVFLAELHKAAASFA